MTRTNGRILHSLKVSQPHFSARVYKVQTQLLTYFDVTSRSHLGSSHAPPSDTSERAAPKPGRTEANTPESRAWKTWLMTDG